VSGGLDLDRAPCCVFGHTGLPPLLPEFRPDAELLPPPSAHLAEAGPRRVGHIGMPNFAVL